MSPTASGAVGAVKRRPLVTIALFLVAVLTTSLIVEVRLHSAPSVQGQPALSTEQLSTLSIAASCAPEGPCYGLDGTGNLGPITGGQLQITTNLAQVLGGLAQGPSLTFNQLSCPRRNDCVAATNLGLVRDNEGALTSFTPWWLLEGGIDLLSCTTSSLCVGASLDRGATDATMVRSTDGGTTWLQVPLPGGVVLADLWCGDTGWCLALGARGGRAVALVSTDAGAAWSTRSAAGLDPSALPQSLACATSTYCVATGSGAPRSSSNGGSAWKTVEGPLGDLGAVTCTVDLSCVLLEATSKPSATVSTTANLGASWTTRALAGAIGASAQPASSQPASISCTVASRCVATTASGAFGFTAPRAER